MKRMTNMLRFEFTDISRKTRGVLIDVGVVVMVMVTSSTGETMVIIFEIWRDLAGL